jgi:hypothetical protein
MRAGAGGRNNHHLQRSGSAGVFPLQPQYLFRCVKAAALPAGHYHFALRHPLDAAGFSLNDLHYIDQRKSEYLIARYRPTATMLMASVNGS